MIKSIISGNEKAIFSKVIFPASILDISKISLRTTKRLSLEALMFLDSLTVLGSTL